ncbi:MAG: CoB--CoM heterodisulfide reductase iron-sulfur subunit A family protein [Nitrospirae bacterium]|nr:CoB--CoM heterodisulfide reductase iron-sulfur subunit A family protein [Nitrospirota bacterium]MBF0533835.1 CoB--CoM heterodisulfide reductase iron-sulfur subunit A family protein [Nitrospirota bacterium]MBF0615456.1 CoB--CoM heterodisulfide reductase iron-sulfur subunit A family protein [Nitrospirota bacterium]
MPEEKTAQMVVIGGGISGMTTAIEAAEAGITSVIIEKSPYLGGRVAQLNKYFPKLCPPYCGMEINFRRIKQNSKISYYTMSEVESVSGSEGNFTVKVKINPRLVNSKCTACNKCVEVCPVERTNLFNFGLDKTKAVYLPHDMAFPMRYVIDDTLCTKASCAKCAAVCKYDAIDFDMKPETVEIKTQSVVYATGWNPYDAKKMDNLGFGKVKNAVTNMMMERMASPNGPTKGKIVRPSDKKEPKTVAFVQCAGSRDINHLAHCSAICCMASLKQATYLREQYPDSNVFIYYIDLRTPGKYEDFLKKIQADENVHMIKGKVAKIEEDPESGDPILTLEDIEGSAKITKKVDMVVLATGMEPAIKSAGNHGLKLDDNGFIDADLQKAGIYSSGVAKRPNDVTNSVQDSTASALRGIQSTVRR